MSETNPPRPRGAATPPKRGISHIPYSKILEYGIYALVFLLPWQTKLILRPGTLNRGVWDYGTISLYGTDILLIALLILFFFLLLRAEAPGRNETAKIINQTHVPFWKKDVVWIILSGLDLVVFISIFFAPDKILAIYRYALLLLGLGLFWLIVKAEYSKKKLAIAFFSGLVIQGVLAIQQFLTQSAPAFKWLGMAAHSPADFGVSVVETAGADGIPERWLRAYGSLDHPNILGGLLAIGLIILALIIIKHQRLDNKKTDWKFIICCLSFIIIGVGLIFSFSRSALAVFAAGLIIFFVFYLVKKDRPAVKKLSGTIILFAILAGLIFLNYQSLFITRAQGTARLETKSFSERKMYLDDSLALLKKNWLFGVGLGNYTKALSENDLHRPWYYLQPVHNTFLLVWTETGIFGLLFFLGFLGYLAFQAIRKKNILSLSVLAGLAIIMSLDHYPWSLHFGVLFFWLAAGAVYKNNNLS